MNEGYGHRWGGACTAVWILGITLLAPRIVIGGVTSAALTGAIEASAPSGTAVVWDEPSHLLEDFAFTPVVGALFARFRDGTEKDVAGCLILESEISTGNPSGLYPHDYRVCQSIHAAQLDGVDLVDVGDATFFLTTMSRPSTTEATISLLVRDHEGIYSVDSRLFSSEYEPGLPGKIYTLQFWSSDGTMTRAIVAGLLEHLAQHQPVIYSGDAPAELPVAFMQYVDLIDARLVVAIAAASAVEDLKLTA